jgi:hypothetical protein
MNKKALAIIVSLFSAAAMAGEDNGARPAVSSTAADIGPIQFNQGQVLCTASVNADGTKAAGESVSGTHHIATGEYEIDFQNACSIVTAARGFARWVQVDTLTTGSAPATVCTTADRDGVVGGVWVACYDSTTGAALDTSFFLFVAR